MAGTTTTGKAKWKKYAKRIIGKVDKAIGTDIGGYVGGSMGKGGKGLDFDEEPKNRKR